MTTACDRALNLIPSFKMMFSTGRFDLLASHTNIDQLLGPRISSLPIVAISSSLGCLSGRVLSRRRSFRVFSLVCSS
jgi:hypothetical protein